MMGCIDQLNKEITFGEFFTNYLMRNQPCMFAAEWTEDWNATRDWVTPHGSPNLGFLREHFGQETVPVKSCQNKEIYGDEKCFQMKLSEFVSYLETTEKDSLLYLKDWHFVKTLPNYSAYLTPKLLSSDWMNEYWDSKNDPEQSDYRFFYFGVKGTWTPFHADVMRSFSWSANICGQKLWYLVPPGNETIFLDKKSNITFLSDIRVRKEFFEEAGVIELIQERGEIIFVPSNWHHQVHNLEDTLSLNHNCFNATNIHKVWQYLKIKLTEVETEVSDCKELLGDEWSQQCQKILRAEAGIDYSEFHKLLTKIKNNRENELKRTANWSKKFEHANIRCTKHYEGQLLSFNEEQECSECICAIKKAIALVCDCVSSSKDLCDSCTIFLVNYDRHICAELTSQVEKELKMDQVCRTNCD